MPCRDRDRDTGEPARGVAIEGADVVGGQAECVDRCLQLGLARAPAVEPHQPGDAAARAGAVDRVPDRGASGIRGGTMETRVPAVAAVDDAVEDAGGVARTLLRDRRATLEQQRGAAALGERLGQRATGQAGADDDHRRRFAAPAADWLPRRGAGREARREAAARDVAFASAARRALDRKASAAQAVANGPRRAPGRHRCIGRRQPRHRLVQPRIPHRRIARGCEAVEKERVDASDELRQPGGDVAECEQQLDAAGFEGDPVQVPRQRRPLPGELLGEWQQERIARIRREVGPRRRRAFDRDEVELAAALCVGTPCGPGGEEIGAQTETGLEDDEAFAAAPARRQRVAVEEDVTCLRERALARVVDVAVLGRARRPVGVTHDCGGADRRRVHRGVTVGALRVASHASRRSRALASPL
jgi:hypothetical protein